MPLSARCLSEDSGRVPAGLFFYASPIARAVIGKTVGDVAVVETPNGKRSYEILLIEYV